MCLWLGLVFFAGLFVLDREVPAPDWLQARIETRLAETAPGLDVRFGRMSVMVQRSGLARIILWDADLRTSRGEPVASVSDIELGLSVARLMRGQVVLREAQVSGAFLTVTRDARGRFALALGDVFAKSTKTPDLQTIIAQVDAAAQDPRLAGLDLFEADALTLRYEDVRAGRGWTVDGGRLRLMREEGGLRLSGDLAVLGGRAGVASMEINAQSALGSAALEFGISLSNLSTHDIATQSPALAWLDALDAPISGALRSSLAEDGGLGLLSASLRIGEGVLQPTLSTRPLPFDGAQTYFTYDAGRGLLQFDEISVASPLGRVTAESRAQIVFDGDWPEAMEVQAHLSQVALAKGAMTDRAITLDGADMAFKLRLAPFEVELGELTLRDPTLPLRASGRLWAAAEGWDLALDLAARQTDVAQVLSYWPQDFRPKVRAWVARNVLAGRLQDVQYALRAPADGDMANHLSFGFRDGTVQINPKLPPIQSAAGQFSLHRGRLGLALAQGVVTPSEGGAIRVAGSRLVIPDLKQKPSRVEISLAASGGLTAALAFVDNPAWQLLAKAGRKPSMATGQARVTGRIGFDMKKGLRLPDIDLALTGDLRDVVGQGVLKGRVLRADRLRLALDGQAVSVEGPLTLDGVPAQARWEQPLSGTAGGRVAAEVTLTPDTLARFGIRLPDGMLRGKGTGALAVDLPRGAAPRFSMTSDLAGLALSLPQIGWRLGTQSTGRFRISGQLGDAPRIDGLRLSGAGLEADAGLTLSPEGRFRSLTLNRLTVGSRMDLTGRIVARGAGVAVEVTSGRYDLRGNASQAGGGGAGRGGGPLTVQLDRLQVTDSIFLTGFRGAFDTTGGLSGDFEGRLGDRTDIKGRIAPQNGRSAVQVEGRDAGDILRAAGLLKTVRDGTFRLSLAPVAGQAGSYDGALEIKETRLRNAPAIGALLDAVSIVGLLDQANGPGIYFTDVEARFRLTPDRVILTRSSAVGPSMGISMDGYYDLGSGQMDMQGVLSPIYFLNAVGRLIARKGEGLIGFNFNLRGSVEAPRVSVNPLSVFTPGMFRDIFRRPPPEVSQ